MIARCAPLAVALFVLPSCSLLAPIQPCETDADCAEGACRELRCDPAAEPTPGNDAGRDAGADPDRDGGPPVDQDPDAGALDAGRVDGGRPFDAGRVDAGADAGVVDAGADAGVVDAGALDAGRVDAGYDGGYDAGYDGGYDAGCLDCRCSGTVWSHLVSDASCERVVLSGGGSSCQSPTTSCPQCDEDVTVFEPALCEELRAGTCEGTVPPVWDALDQASCGSGCWCETGVPTETQCRVGTEDEDDDGDYNCDDDDCAGEPCDNTGKSCQPDATLNGALACLPPEYCALGTGDENHDGAADCADFDCQGKTCGAGCRCVGYSATETDCSNGSDDDDDGLADCLDVLDCKEGDRCSSGSIATAKCESGVCAEYTCDGWFDNDGDGLCDCQDPDCGGPIVGCSCRPGTPSSQETACSDGQDNDLDGDRDCDDPDCAADCGG